MSADGRRAEIPGISAFAETFEETLQAQADHDAIKGYVGAWTINT